MTEQVLTSKRVVDIFDDCVSDDGEIEADVLTSIARFDRAKIAKHQGEIIAMLMELPEQFRESGGGGWSFLNACDNRYGEQWTDFHAVMARLFGLGQAVGIVICQLPRSMWSALPGGMPYYVINDRSFDPAKGDGA